MAVNRKTLAMYTLFYVLLLGNLRPTSPHQRIDRTRQVTLLGVTSYSKTSVQVPAANHSSGCLTDTLRAANRKRGLVRRGQDFSPDGLTGSGAEGYHVPSS